MKCTNLGAREVRGRNTIRGQRCSPRDADAALALSPPLLFLYHPHTSTNGPHAAAGPLQQRGPDRRGQGPGEGCPGAQGQRRHRRRGPAAGARAARCARNALDEPQAAAAARKLRRSARARAPGCGNCFNDSDTLADAPRALRAPRRPATTPDRAICAAGAAARPALRCSSPRSGDVQR